MSLVLYAQSILKIPWLTKSSLTIRYLMNKVAFAAPWADFSVPIDPHFKQIPKFCLDNQLKIVSAGSCFAQRISQSLQANNFNYLFTEQAPPFCFADISQTYNYGVFSAFWKYLYSPPTSTVS